LSNCSEFRIPAHEGHIEWGTQEPAPCTDAQPVSGSQPVQSSRALGARRAPQA
jgi:hypothetical protein